MSNSTRPLIGAALAFSLVVLVSGCGGSDDRSPKSADSSKGTSWDEVTTAACQGFGTPTDAAKAIEEKLSGNPEQLQQWRDMQGMGMEPSGQLEWLSCSGEAPYMRLFDSETALQIYEKDYFSDGCSGGSAVAGDRWVVSAIEDSSVASALVALGGELQDC